MLTSFADDEALFASIMAGAADYVLKQIRGDELIRAIREMGAGKSLLDPEVTRSVLERLRKGKTLRDEKLARLTAQEERILILIANGQIGKELKLAEKTVKNYVSTILSKLDAGDGPKPPHTWLDTRQRRGRNRKAAQETIWTRLQHRVHLKARDRTRCRGLQWRFFKSSLRRT
jgi:DNA-binding NarL/FixJ family response regulator